MLSSSPTQPCKAGVTCNRLPWHHCCQVSKDCARFGLFSHVRASVHSRTISPLARHRPARSSSLLPHHPPGQPLRLCHGLFLCSPLHVAPRRCPGKEGVGCSATVTASRVCRGAMAAGWAGAGLLLCHPRYKFRLPGGRWLLLLGAGLASR